MLNKEEQKNISMLVEKFTRQVSKNCYPGEEIKTFSLETLKVLKLKKLNTLYLLIYFYFQSEILSIFYK